MQNERIGEKSAHGNASLLTKLLTPKKWAGVLVSFICNPRRVEKSWHNLRSAHSRVQSTLWRKHHDLLSQKIVSCGSPRSKSFSTTSAAGTTLDEFLSGKKKRHWKQSSRCTRVQAQHMWWAISGDYVMQCKHIYRTTSLFLSVM